MRPTPPGAQTIPDANVATIEVTTAGTPVGNDRRGRRLQCQHSELLHHDGLREQDQRQQGQRRRLALPGGRRGRWHRGVQKHGQQGGGGALQRRRRAGRDHWLAAGEPHCADCHAAPYVEQTGNQSPMSPFNYPAQGGADALLEGSPGHQLPGLPRVDPRPLSGGTGPELEGLPDEPPATPRPRA